MTNGAFTPAETEAKTDTDNVEMTTEPNLNLCGCMSPHCEQALVSVWVSNSVTTPMYQNKL